MLPSNALRKEPQWWDVISVPFLVFHDWPPAQVAEGACWKFPPASLLAAHGEDYCLAGSLRSGDSTHPDAPTKVPASSHRSLCGSPQDTLFEALDPRVQIALRCG